MSMDTPTQGITISGFSGMNNVKCEENFYSDSGIVEPKIILNADVDITHGLVKRAGITKVVDLPNAQSLWAGTSCMLCVSDNKLYRISQNEAIFLGNINSNGLPIDYVEINGKVYFSNQYCRGILDVETNVISDWGIDPPAGPMLLSGTGSLPPGTYHVTMTYSAQRTDISGNGPISSIELSQEGGIQIFNRPSDAIVWCTDTNESIFYRVGQTNKIVYIETIEPCPSFMCSPPPFLSNLCNAFGRIWGSSEATLYYSQPFKYEWFKITTNYFKFNSEITVIAKVPTGLFVGCKDATWFLEGTEPESMQQSSAGSGSVSGTLTYCNNVPYLADILGTPEKNFFDVPIWITHEGIVAGNVNGRLFNLTNNKLAFGIPERGASLYRTQQGSFQFLSSFKKGTMGSGAGFSDEVTCEVFRNGTIVPE